MSTLVSSVTGTSARWASRMLLGVVLVAAMSTFAHAGITADNVIGMHKSGLPPAVIIQTIKSTNSTFNLTVDDLRKLEEAGVPSDVLEAMMSTGAAAPAPEPAPEASPIPEPEGDPLERLRQAEESEREKIEEEARIREAARRAADAERAKMNSEEQARTRAALAAANAALQKRDYRTAAIEYQRFLTTAEPNKPSGMQARLGLADALFGLGLYANAAEIYHELLGAGSETAVFIPAFEGLRRCSQKVAYNPVTLEALTSYFVGNAEQTFQDSYHYFLGKFFFDYNRWEDARRYLSQVSGAAADYPDAQYLQGLIGVIGASEAEEESGEWAQALIAANGHFQQAVQGAPEDSESRVKDLSYLALARIAYTLGSYDAALFYYRKVPSDSTNYVNALYESGWSYFLKGDVRRGLGIFHTLDGPDWEHHFLPDAHLLEAAAFMNTCYFDYAHDALRRIESRYLTLRQPVTLFLQEYSSPEALYQAFVLRQSRRGIELPRLVRMAIVSNDEFYDLYTTVTQLRREVAKIRAERAVLGADLTDTLLSRVENRQKESTIALGIKISELLSEMERQLNELDIKAAEIRIEIDEAASEELEQETKDLYQGAGASLSDDKAAQAAASALVGNQYQRWPFEGEYWVDEINSFRSNLKEVCKR